jgi:hypothetical protein
MLDADHQPRKDTDLTDSATTRSGTGRGSSPPWTYGLLIDGVVLAATGRSLGEVYAEVVRPASGIDAWFGVSESDLGRVADLEHAVAYVTRRLHDFSRAAEIAAALGDHITIEVTCQ